MIRYPYVAYSDNVDLAPLFPGLKGDPLVVDISLGSDVYNQVDIMDQQAFQAWLDAAMADRYSWGVSSYLEDRRTILSHYPQMKEEQRYYHLGLDIIVPLGTALHAPLDSVVEQSGYEQGKGNYGGNVLLRHDSPCFDTFYSLYGHLNRESLPAKGDEFKAGQVFARIGDFHENGDWFYHTHLQVITRKGLDQGWVSKGYCSAKDLAQIDRLCPSPLSLFRVG